jgi:hypothetical protein
MCDALLQHLAGGFPCFIIAKEQILVKGQSASHICKRSIEKRGLRYGWRMPPVRVHYLAEGEIPICHYRSDLVKVNWLFGKASEEGIKQETVTEVTVTVFKSELVYRLFSLKVQSPVTL